MQIIQLIRQSNWIAVNKQLVKAVGCNAAYLLGYLADKHSYFETRGELTHDGYFFAKISDVEDDIALGRKEQDTAISKLSRAGLISTDARGVPPKRYFSFTSQNQQALLTILVGQIDLPERDKLNCSNQANSFAPKGQIDLPERDKLNCSNRANSFAPKGQYIYIDNNNHIKEKEFITGKPENSLNDQFIELSMQDERNPAREHRDELAASEAANPTSKKTRKEKMASWLPLIDGYMQREMPAHYASTEFMQALQAYLFNRCEGSAHSFFGGMVAIEKWVAAMKGYEPEFCVKLLDDALANDYKRAVFESTPAQYKYYLQEKQAAQAKAQPKEANPFAQFGCSDAYFETFKVNVRTQYDLQAWVNTLLKNTGKLDPAKGIIPSKEETENIYRIARLVKPSITQ